MHKNVFMAKAECQIALYKEMLVDLDILSKTFTQFDGKVLNVRFTKATKQNGMSGIMCLRSSYDASVREYEISYCNSNQRNYFIKSVLPNGGHTVGYVDDDSSYVSVFIDPETSRIDSSKSIEKLDTCRSNIKSYIAKWEYCIEHFDEIAERTAALDKAIEQFNKDIPYFARPYFRATSGVRLEQ